MWLFEFLFTGQQKVASLTIINTGARKGVSVLSGAITFKLQCYLKTVTKSMYKSNNFKRKKVWNFSNYKRERSLKKFGNLRSSHWTKIHFSVNNSWIGLHSTPTVHSYGMVPVVPVFHRIRPFFRKLNLGKVKKKF